MPRKGANFSLPLGLRNCCPKKLADTILDDAYIQLMSESCAWEAPEATADMENRPASLALRVAREYPHEPKRVDIKSSKKLDSV